MFSKLFYQYFGKERQKRKWPWALPSFPYFKSIGKSILANWKYACLLNSFQMSRRWALYNNFAVLTLMIQGHWSFGGRGNQTSKLSRDVWSVFLAYLIFAYVLATLYLLAGLRHQKVLFWDTLTARLRIISSGETVKMPIPSGEP